MLRVVFLGMDLRILDTLRTCPVNLCGAYVPPVSSFFLYRTAWLKNIIPRFIIKKKLQVAAAFAGVFQYLEYHQIPALPAKNVNSQKFLKGLTVVKSIYVSWRILTKVGPSITFHSKMRVYQLSSFATSQVPRSSSVQSYPAERRKDFWCDLALCFRPN